MAFDFAAVGWFLADIVAGRLLDARIDKGKKEQLKRDVQIAFEKALVDVSDTFPGFACILEDSTFLSRTRVNRELSNLISPTDSPNIETLVEEWENYFGKPLQGSSRSFIEAFLRKATINLKQISDLQELIHIKEEHQFKKILTEEFRTFNIELNELTTSVQSLLPSKVSGELAPIDKEVLAKAEICHDLLRSGRPNAALSQVLELEALYQKSTISNQTKSRLITIKGGAYYTLGQIEQAISLFKQANILDPENSKTKANKALCLLLAGAWEEAEILASEVSQDTSSKTAARGVYVQAVAYQRNYQNLEDLVDERYFNDIDYVRSLGFVFIKAKEFRRAESFLEICIALDENEYYSRLLMAQAIIEEHLDKSTQIVFEPLILSDTTKQRLGKAQDVLNEALLVARRGDNRNFYLDALAAYAASLALLGKTDEAIKACDEVLNEKPDHPSGLRNRAMLALQRDDDRLAEFNLEKLPVEYQKDISTKFALVRAYVGMGKETKAIEIIDQITENIDTKKALPLFAVKAQALVQLGNKTEANKLKDRLIKAYPDALPVLEVAAFIDEIQGRRDAAIATLLRAANLTEGKELKLVSLRLGILFYKQKQLRDASEWFRKGGEYLYADTNFVQMAAITYQQLHLYSDVLTLCREARKVGIETPFLLKVEAWTNEHLGDLQNAFEIYSKLRGFEPNVLEHIINQARVVFRTGDYVGALKLVEAIDNSKVEDAYQLMFIAELYSFADKPKKAIEMAYKARHKGYYIPEIHLAYINIFFKVENDLEDLNPIQIIDNTAVLIRMDNVQRWLKIISILKPDLSRNEYSISYIVSQRLLGHRVGEEVLIQERMFDKISYFIEEIQSLYVRALQESMEEFLILFPTHPGFEVLKVAGGDLTRFLTIIAGQSTFAQSTYSLYHEGVVTLEQFGHLIGRNQLDVLQSIIGLPGHRVYASSGFHDIQDAQLKTAKAADSVTIGLSALFTLHMLKLLDRLAARFANIYVPQAVMDELNQTIMSRQLEAKRGSKSIEFSGDRFICTEIVPELIQRGVKRLEEISSFVRNNCTIVPLSVEQAQHLQENVELKNYLGEVSFSTIFAAQANDTPLLVDDWRLLHTAVNEFNIKGFWSQALIRNLVDLGHINSEEFYEAITTLSLGHYYYTSLNPDIVYYELAKNHFTVNRGVSELMSVLHGPDTIEDDAVALLCDLTIKVWTSTTTRFQRCTILDKVLDVLVSGRDADIALYKFKQQLIGLVNSRPAIYKQIRKEINLWCDYMKQSRGLNLL